MSMSLPRLSSRPPSFPIPSTTIGMGRPSASTGSPKRATRVRRHAPRAASTAASARTASSRAVSSTSAWPPELAHGDAQHLLVAESSQGAIQALVVPRLARGVGDEGADVARTLLGAGLEDRGPQGGIEEQERQECRRVLAQILGEGLHRFGRIGGALDELLARGSPSVGHRHGQETATPTPPRATPRWGKPCREGVEERARLVIRAGWALSEPGAGPAAWGGGQVPSSRGPRGARRPGRRAGNASLRPSTTRSPPATWSPWRRRPVKWSCPILCPRGLLFLTAGSGITPALSMVGEPIATGRLPPDTIWVHHAQGPEHLIDRERLARWAAGHSALRRRIITDDGAGPRGCLPEAFAQSTPALAARRRSSAGPRAHGRRRSALGGSRRCPRCTESDSGRLPAPPPSPTKSP